MSYTRTVPADDLPGLKLFYENSPLPWSSPVIDFMGLSVPSAIASTAAGPVLGSAAASAVGAADTLLSPFFGFDNISQCETNDGAQDHDDQ